jgi:type I restriction enzyme S subunit
MFRKETEIQETEIGEIPKDWKIERLGHLINYVKGKKPKKLYDQKINENNLPYLTAEYMRGLETPKWCDPKEDPNVIKVNSDDIIMIWDGSYAGHVFTGYNGALASTMIKIIPKYNNLDKKFMYYYLTISFQILRGTTIGTGVPHINKKIFEELYIPLPPLEEQKRIADILSIIDSSIGTVDRAIVKLEGMKRALLNELLTGRIRVREENGKLTFYKETEFQDTEIGRIPKDWYVKRLKEVADFQRGFSYKSDEKFTEEVPDGYLFLTLNSVKEGGGLKEDGWTWIKSDRLEERHFVKEGDIVIANTEQSKDGSLLGSPAIVHFPEWYKKDKAVFSHHISRLLLKINNIDVNFLFYYLSFVQPIARKYHTGTGVWGLDVDKWSTDLLIPLPPIKEQTAIAEILSTVDKAIELYRKEKERLLRLKRGLMSVLLTGRVRVIGDVKNVGVVT